MKIRALKKQDISRVTQIIANAIHLNAAKSAKKDFERSFHPHVKTFYRLLKFWVAYENDILVGVIGVGSLHSTPLHVAWLDWFAIDPKFKGQGIGSMLLDVVVQELEKKEMTILVVECYLPYGEAAIDFYKRHGFVAAGRIRGYWTYTIDSVLLVKYL